MKVAAGSIKSKILAIAANSKLSGDIKIPSELTLCEQFDVSRSTLREALAQLIQEGVVYRVRGKGAYLRSGLTTLNLDISKLFSVTDAIKCCDAMPSTDLRYTKVKSADQHIANKLNINVGENYLEIERVRYADGKVAVFNRHSFKMDALSGASTEDLCGSLFDFLEKSGNTISYAKTKIRSTVLTRRDIENLESEIASFILLEEIYHSDQGEVFCYTNDYYADDTFSFDIIRRR
ncbi:GntR family transcriptional regulator [Agarivorans sp. QJM3NY_29]|uniref:GntR family transcriptional regulator n=1 Tax=unclassified Agarivorans TaxID=2636026 RepID=UPI003D7D6740